MVIDAKIQEKMYFLLQIQKILFILQLH